MTPLDRFIQRRRIVRAMRHIPPRSRVLDIGCFDGLLLRSIDTLVEGVGIDPLIETHQLTHNVTLIGGMFPAALSPHRPFDVITMLAVLEHIPHQEQSALAAACMTRLRSGGRLIVTVPSPAVDSILAVLVRLKLVHGMSLEQHYGFEPRHTVPVFEGAGFRLSAQERFQAGLNNLFVFTKN
jgi:2-polyprenyl-3-methyl-5-hydroxy-6-metoxy-1,4-benzoquinol methylase